MAVICAIETGAGNAELVERFGDYPSMTLSFLQPHLEGATFSVVSPATGERLPDAGAFDGYVILGSRHGVYDPLPWIEPLKHLIRHAADRRIPMVGICFGHQIMADFGLNLPGARQINLIGVRESILDLLWAYQAGIGLGL